MDDIMSSESPLLYRCTSVNQSQALQKRLASHEAMQRVMSEQSQHAISSLEDMPESHLFPSLDDDKGLPLDEDVLSDHRSSPVLRSTADFDEEDDDNNEQEDFHKNDHARFKKFASNSKKKLGGVRSFRNIIQRMRSSNKKLSTTEQVVSTAPPTRTTSARNSIRSIPGLTTVGSINGTNLSLKVMEEEELLRILCEEDVTDEGTLPCKMMDSVRSIRILSSFSTEHQESIREEHGESSKVNSMMENGIDSEDDEEEEAIAKLVARSAKLSAKTNKNRSSTGKKTPLPVQTHPLSEISIVHQDHHWTPPPTSPHVVLCGGISNTTNADSNATVISDLTLNSGEDDMLDEANGERRHSSNWAHYFQLYEIDNHKDHPQPQKDKTVEDEKQPAAEQDAGLQSRVSAMGSLLHEYLWFACAHVSTSTDTDGVCATKDEGSMNENGVKKIDPNNQHRKKTHKKKHKKVPSTIQAHILKLASETKQYSPSLQELDNCSTMTESTTTAASSIVLEHQGGGDPHDQKRVTTTLPPSVSWTTLPRVNGLFRFDID